MAHNVLVKTNLKFRAWNAEQAAIIAATVNSARRDIISYATHMVRTDVGPEEVAFLGKMIRHNREVVARSMGVSLAS